MRRLLAAGLVFGFGLLGVADADAGNRPCDHCAASSVTRHVRTIHPVIYVTHYHDRSVYHHVTRLHYVLDVTRIQPIVQVRDITRLHHVTVVRDAYAEQLQSQVPAAYGVEERPANLFGSGCACVDRE